MTKEETLSYLKAYLNGDTAIGNIISLRSVLESALKYLEPSLPANLDEAAEKIASDIVPKYPDINWDICFEKIVEGVKAGAEWMAGQGETFNGFMSVSGKMSLIAIEGSSQNFKFGDNVIVQFRKKQ